MEKTQLKYFTKSVFGIIYTDINGNFYKLTSLMDVETNYFISKNNFMEYFVINKLIATYKNTFFGSSIILSKDELYEKYTTEHKLADNFVILTCMPLQKTKEIHNKNIFLLTKVSLHTFIRYIHKYRSDDDIYNIFLIITKQVMEQLNQLYAINILHGDLKAENILVNPYTLSVQLIDFGGSCNMNALKYSRTCTLTTLCPEHLDYSYTNSFDFAYEQRNEIWSLGTIFSYFLLGKDIIRDKYDNIVADMDKNISNQEIYVETKLVEWYNKQIYLDLESKYMGENKNIKNALTFIEQMCCINIKRRPFLDEIYMFFTKRTLERIQIEPKLYNAPPNFISIRKNLYRFLNRLGLHYNIMECIPMTISTCDIFFFNYTDRNYMFEEKYMSEYTKLCIASLIICYMLTYSESIDIQTLKKIYQSTTHNVFIEKVFNEWKNVILFVVKNFCIYTNFDIPYNNYKINKLNKYTIYNKINFAILDNIMFNQEMLQN